MKRMLLYIVVGLVVVLGVAFLFGIRGMKETLGLQISRVDLSGVADGTYKGSYEAGRFKASVEVMVRDQDSQREAFGHGQHQSAGQEDTR